MPQLKMRYVIGLDILSAVEDVVNVLHLKRLYNVPNLYLKYAKLVANKFKNNPRSRAMKILS